MILKDDSLVQQYQAINKEVKYTTITHPKIFHTNFFKGLSMCYNTYYLKLKSHIQYLQKIKDRDLFKAEFKKLYLYHINITKKITSYVSRNGIRIAEYTKQTVKNEFRNILVNYKSRLNTSIDNSSH